jgi:hypothetical protein
VKFKVVITMKIQVVVSYHITAWCHNPEDHDLDEYRCLIKSSNMKDVFGCFIITNHI